MPSQPMPVRKLKPGDVIRFAGQDETIRDITPNQSGRKLFNIYFVGMKSPLIEYGHEVVEKVNP